MRTLHFCVAVALVLSGCSTFRTLRANPLPEPTAGDHPTKETKKGTLFFPISGDVEEGVAYRFNTGHCGLGYLTDFDGSFWTPINPDPGREPPAFFSNEDEGAMKLVSEDKAEYTSSDGVTVTLERHVGPYLLKGLCA